MYPEGSEKLGESFQLKFLLKKKKKDSATLKYFVN